MLNKRNAIVPWILNLNDKYASVPWIARTTVATVSEQEAKTRHCLGQIGQYDEQQNNLKRGDSRMTMGTRLVSNRLAMPPPPKKRRDHYLSNLL